MPERELAARLDADRIDIALDLAGHTGHNSVRMFALRMAPVQVSAIGYPDTTGLAQMDYRIVDSYTDPREPAVDARATEKLYRLDPCFLCYRPPDEAPLPARDAADPGTGPVFGSFNASHKHNRQLIGVWARILKEVPNATMVLKAQDLSEGVAARLLSRFAAAGISPDRVHIMESTKSLAEHLSAYGQVDVALDPFPYNGTTTTCEALWMSVPVVALAGRTPASRVGVSLLTNAGIPELIAQSEDEYVRLATDLISDAPRLAAYRSTLRDRLAVSAIGDAKGYAQRLGAAFRNMWRAYCK